MFVCAFDFFLFVQKIRLSACFANNYEIANNQNQLIQLQVNELTWENVKEILVTIFMLSPF